MFSFSIAIFEVCIEDASLSPISSPAKYAWACAAILLLSVQLSAAASGDPTTSDANASGVKESRGPEAIAAANVFNEKQMGDLSSLEKRYFEHDFPSDKIDDRLTRLEQLIFGSQIKNNSQQRLLNLIAKTKPEVIEAAEISKSKPNEKVAPVTFKSAMDSGINNYKSQRYHHAQQDFEKAISLNPRSPEAYANLGGVLIMLRDRESAKEAFKACFSLHPFGKLGAYAREKMLKLAEEDAYAKTNPQDTTETVNRTAALIDRQCADRTAIYQDRANYISGYRRYLTNMQIQKLTGNPYYGINGNNQYHPNEDISNLDFIRSNYLRSDGVVQSNLALIDGNKKSTSVFESGASLKEQMLKPVPAGGAKLRALGTSLYARYYGDGLPSIMDSPPADPPPPALEATANKLPKP